MTLDDYVYKRGQEKAKKAKEEEQEFAKKYDISIKEILRRSK